MKVKSAIKKICGFCRIVRRGKYLYVRCEKYNRHKQRQGFSTMERNINLDKEKFCECDSINDKQIEISQEDEKLYNIIEEECECCGTLSNSSEIDINKELASLKMI